jgi:phenylpyruvate tautomerase PptA (4-oxalocrotonate tautomerase family)
VPLIRIEIREGWSRAEKARLLDANHAAAVEALKIPDEDRTQILTEHPAEAFEFPPGKGDRFTLIQITMLAGRSLDAKRRLCRAVVRNRGRTRAVVALLDGAERRHASRPAPSHRWSICLPAHAPRRPGPGTGGWLGSSPARIGGLLRGGQAWRRGLVH